MARGSVIQRGDSWRIRVPLGKDEVTGKYRNHFETVVGPRKLADKRLRELLKSIDDNRFVKPSKLLLKDYLEQWLSDTAMPNMSPRNFEGYEFNVNRYIIPAIGLIPLSEVKPQHIQKLIGDIQKEGHNRTAEYIYSTLIKSLGSAVKTNLLAINPALQVEKPHVPKSEFKTLDKADLNILLDLAKKTPHNALFYTALFTGMRRSELLALQWNDVDLLLCLLYVNRSLVVIRSGVNKGQITFKQPKTSNSRRPIDLTPSNTLILKAHKDVEMAKTSYFKIPWTEDRLVFCNFDGSPYKPDAISHYWHKLIVRAGLEGVRLHDCRHTMATLMLKDGVHPKLVQERLGHKSIETTLDTYSHCVPGLQKALAKRFDELVLPEETKEKTKVEKEVNILFQK